ncbi:TPA: 2,3-diaminopropionate biosynthesis protein SbnA [Serratia marcescens]|nr:2,3-diaminopropionate biosynthesis protein SbnA [Serratia marcescens]OFS90160.1 2,3-diaminopropionate biosynthesis protein SbnA [Serratia sp. HMSC15F11]AVU43011.1 2,3-diaminopropionate biosynthesis protein SbnA [Serratia marcescens]EGT0503045.1 2,3-diaminopropionate biosynthesis protein SbnA [Serratia marcescens]EHT9830702.1 2,3-diaminopropionate biosynthesis protein SbnA [Serratia marcescens]
MIANSPMELLISNVFIKLSVAKHFQVNLKLEGLSATGSIKVKSGLRMISQLEQQGLLRKGMKIIESSSGNLGLALSMICAAKGYSFTCVSDPNISPQTARIIQAYGAKLIIVKDRDANGGYLATRINLIKSLLKQDADLLWVNQYENEENVHAHYCSTAPEILAQFPEPDYVFIGAGTTGTLGGVSRYLREKAPKTKIIAVDSQGSITFGQPAGKRLIPGLGTSNPPAIRQYSSFDELLMIPELDTVRMCRQLAQQGMLLGGSSGTVLCGVQRYASAIPPGACVVAISPDMGDRYVDTLYNPDWVNEHFPEMQGYEKCAIAI